MVRFHWDHDGCYTNCACNLNWRIKRKQLGRVFLGETIFTNYLSPQRDEESNRRRNHFQQVYLIFSWNDFEFERILTSKTNLLSLLFQMHASLPLSLAFAFDNISSARNSVMRPSSANEINLCSKISNCSEFKVFPA